MHNIIMPIPLNKLSNEPLVSVWMTNYNYANFLDESINSVLNQTYSKFELIICDDGSTDNSLEIIKKYIRQDNRIKLIEKKNGGVASALNNIYEISKGEIICFLDSDDYFAKTKVEKVENDFKKNPDCGVHTHYMMRVNQNNQEQGRYPLFGKSPNGWLGEELIKNDGSILHIAPTSGISLRKEIIIKIFPIDIKLKSNIDGFILTVSLLLSRIISNSKELSFYRLHAQNLSNPFKKRNSVNEIISKRKRESEITLQIYKMVNIWIEKHYKERLVLNINNNWQFIECKYIICKLTNCSTKEMEFWYKKLIYHPLSNSNKYLKYFYMVVTKFNSSSFIFFLSLKSSQGRTKLFLGKIIQYFRNIL